MRCPLGGRRAGPEPHPEHRPHDQAALPAEPGAAAPGVGTGACCRMCWPVPVARCAWCRLPALPAPTCSQAPCLPPPICQFIVVSLKEGMFNNANVIFRTKFVDGVSVTCMLQHTVRPAVLGRVRRHLLPSLRGAAGRRSPWLLLWQCTNHPPLPQNNTTGVDRHADSQHGSGGGSGRRPGGRQQGGRRPRAGSAAGERARLRPTCIVS